MKIILLQVVKKMQRHSYFNCILIRSYSKINSTVIIKIMLSEGVHKNYKHLDGVLLSEFMKLKLERKAKLIQVKHLNSHQVVIKAFWEDQMNLPSKKSKCF